MKPGYKKTEVGVMPEEWTLRGLGDVSVLDIGLSKPKIVFGSGCPVVTVQDLYSGDIINSSALKRVVVTEDEIQRYRLEKDDILIGNASVKRDGIGYSNRFDGANEDVIFAKYAYRARTTRTILPAFLHHVLRSQFCRQWIISNSQTGTLTNLNKTAARSIPIAVPPLPEQRLIAEALSDVDGLLGALERLIAKKRDLKQAAMQQLLTGQTRLPGFSGPWVIKRLGDVLTICHGRSQREVQIDNGPYPILATGGQIGTASRFLYDKPSVLIGRKGTIDQPQYMDTPFWTVDTLFYSIIHDDNNAKFLFYRFCLIDWKQYNEASGVPSLNARTIESVIINCPKADEQTAIAAVLSEQDGELAVLEQRREKTRALKQAMMQELLTGRTRLLE